jgi:hypothetical protein
MRKPSSSLNFLHPSTKSQGEGNMGPRIEQGHQTKTLLIFASIHKIQEQEHGRDRFIICNGCILHNPVISTYSRSHCLQGALIVRNRTLTLIEREDDTRSWGNFLIYFSHSTTMPYPPRGWGYILIGR